MIEAMIYANSIAAKHVLLFSKRTGTGVININRQFLIPVFLPWTDHGKQYDGKMTNYAGRYRHSPPSLGCSTCAGREHRDRYQFSQAGIYCDFVLLNTFSQQNLDPGRQKGHLDKLEGIFIYRIYANSIGVMYILHNKSTSSDIFNDSSRFQYFNKDLVILKTDLPLYYVFNRVSRISIILSQVFITFPVYFLNSRMVRGLFPVTTIHA